MRIITVVFQFIMGLVFAVGCWLALSPFFAAILPNNEDIFTNLSLVATVGVVALVALAPTFRRCLGRGFLLIGVCLFLLPLSTTFLSVEVGSQLIDEANKTDELEVAATAVGAALGGTAVAIISGFFGFFLGAIALIVGLVLSLGGRREVIVVENRSSTGRREPTFRK